MAEAVVFHKEGALVFGVIRPIDGTHEVILYADGAWYCNCHTAYDGFCYHIKVVAQDPAAQEWLVKHRVTATRTEL